MSSKPTAVSQMMKDICQRLYDYMPLDAKSPKCKSIFRHELKDINTYYGSHLTTTTVCENGQTLSFFIANEANLPALQTAIDLKASIHHRDNRGRTLMHAACMTTCIADDLDCSSEDMVDFLLNKIDINAVDNRGRTPLFEVAEVVRENKKKFNTLKQVRALKHFIEHVIACGADIHHRDCTGKTFVYGVDKLPQNLGEIFNPYVHQIQNRKISQRINVSLNNPKLVRKI